MITIYGASDDLVEVDGCEGADEFGSFNETWSARFIGPGATEQILVTVWYGNEGAWQIGVGQVDEDVPFPAWPLKFSQHERGYSVQLDIDAPDGTRLEVVEPART